MSHHQSLREQLDAHRVESDLARPELRELAEGLAGDRALAKELARSQRFDRAVVAGLTDLPAPDGLAERILAAVHEAESQTAGRELTLEIGKRLRNRPWPDVLRSRKLWYSSAAAAAVLMMAVAGAFFWHRSQQIFEQEQIASALGGWQMAASSSRSERGLPSDFVLPPLPVKPQRYLPFKTAEGWSAVAFDCTTAGGSPATLIIVQQPSQFRLGAPTVTRLAPAGRKIAAWRKGRHLYVLVEEAAKPRAGAMLRRASSPPA